MVVRYKLILIDGSNEFQVEDEAILIGIRELTLRLPLILLIRHMHCKHFGYFTVTQAPH